MLSQKEFVEGCYNWYREADLQPGNPEDGDWDEAHYPVPKCKGGTETILLLRGHHAVQGVIQSEELQWKCIFGWENKYLSGEYLELFNKWVSEGAKLFWADKTEEERRLWTENQKEGWARKTEEEKILIAEKRRINGISQHERMTEEEKILWTEKLTASQVARHARMTEEEKILSAEKMRTTWKNKPEEEVNLRREHQRSFLTSWWEKQTPEEKIQQSNKMKEGWARRREREAQELLARWKEGVVRECIL